MDQNIPESVNKSVDKGELKVSEASDQPTAKLKLDANVYLTPEAVAEIKRRLA